MLPALHAHRTFGCCAMLADDDGDDAAEVIGALTAQASEVSA